MSTVCTPNTQQALACISELIARFNKLGPSAREEEKSWKPLVAHFNKLAKLRSECLRVSNADALCMQLSCGMWSLNTVLLDVPQAPDSDKLKTFYNMWVVVDKQRDLLNTPEFHRTYTKAMVTACVIGLRLHGDPQYAKHLAKEPNRLSDFLMRLHKVCTELAIEGTILDSEDEKVKQQACNFITNLEQCANQAVSCLILAKTQWADRKYEAAIETLTSVSSPRQGIQDVTVWAARCHMAECYQAMGIRARKDGDVERAESHFKTAEGWYVEASRVWEPASDPRQSQCQAQQNERVHGQMAWFYLCWDKPEQAAQSAQHFLGLTSTANGTPYYWRTCCNLGTALIRQRLNEDAIGVFDDVVSRTDVAQYRIRALSALRILYLWQEDTTNHTKTTCDLISALKAAKAEGSLGHYATAIKELTDEDLNLLYPTVMTGFVTACHKKLADGSAPSLIQKLPLLNEAFRALSPEGHDDSVLLSLLGEAYFQVGNLDRALAIFLAVAKKDQSAKNQAISWLYVGNIYSGMGKYDDALQAYAKSYRAKKDNVFPLLKAATVCRLKGDFGQALGYLDRIAKECPDTKPNVTRTLRAKTLWARGEHDQNNQDVKDACSILVKILQDGAPDILVVRLLVDKVAYPDAQVAIANLIRTSTDYKLIEMLRSRLASRLLP